MSELSVPGCDKCARAANGLCFEHAGAKAVPDADDARRCVGVKADGSRCTKWALRDGDMCLVHDKKRRGEFDRAATTSARGLSKSKLLQAAQDHLRTAGRDMRNVDALEELENLAAEALDLKDWFRLRMVEMLDQLRKNDALDTHEFEARLNLYTAALERAATLVTGYGKHGLEKRLVEQREELAAVVSSLFMRMLAEFVPAERQQAARVLLAQSIAAIEAPQ